MKCMERFMIAAAVMACAAMAHAQNKAGETITIKPGERVIVEPGKPGEKVIVEPTVVQPAPVVKETVVEKVVEVEPAGAEESRWTWDWHERFAYVKAGEKFTGNEISFDFFGSYLRTHRKFNDFIDEPEHGTWGGGIG